MKKQIAVLPGDGIGPEVIGQAIKVLDAVAERYGHNFFYRESHIGAVAIDHHGIPLPEETIDICKASDAILFGATGHPDYDREPTHRPRPEDGLLGLRKKLGLYANVRPVKLFEALYYLSPLRTELVRHVDMLFIRELTGGLYFGEKGRLPDGDGAFDQSVYKRSEIERISHVAFEEAMRRRKKLTLVDKSNVLETSKLWREIVLEISPSYPEVEVECIYADRMAMQLLLTPAAFDVILAANFLGDILSEEAAVITGSLGLLPSASLGLSTSLYEPVHGAWPKASGQDRANPIAAILSAGMMLADFGLDVEAEMVKAAVARVLARGIGTPDLRPASPSTCNQVGDMIAFMVLDDELDDLRRDGRKNPVSTII